MKIYTVIFCDNGPTYGVEYGVAHQSAVRKEAIAYANEMINQNKEDLFPGENYLNTDYYKEDMTDDEIMAHEVVLSDEHYNEKSVKIYVSDPSNDLSL